MQQDLNAYKFVYLGGMHEMTEFDSKDCEGEEELDGGGSVSSTSSTLKRKFSSDEYENNIEIKEEVNEYADNSKHNESEHNKKIKTEKCEIGEEQQNEASAEVNGIMPQFPNDATDNSYTAPTDLNSVFIVKEEVTDTSYIIDIKNEPCDGGNGEANEEFLDAASINDDVDDVNAAETARPSRSGVRCNSEKMKWNVNHIVEFLNVYQQYPVLWNIKDKDYGNTKLKIEIFQRLFSELNEKQLIMGMDMKQLKCRIKSIKDVCRQELNKIEKSKKSGCGSDEVYSPKLAWFNEASYLTEILATRSGKSNLDLSQYCQESVPDESSEKETVESKDEKETFKSHPKMRPPATPMKWTKKRASSQNEISEVINQLDKIAQNAAKENPFDLFGKFVASELRQLPQREAILLQQEIHNSIVRFKLDSLDVVVGDNAFSSCSNHSLSSN